MMAEARSCAVVLSQKPLSAIKEEAAANAELNDGVKFGLFDLLMIGIGGTVGTGVFVLVGDVLPIAGPSAILSWLVAGFACLLSALAYMELSSRIPTSGSCYIFSYHAIGELAGVVGAVCLTLEYGVSAAGVARSWSGEFSKLLGAEKVTQIWYSGEPTEGSDAYIDWMAGLMMALCVGIVSAGVNTGKLIANIFTIAKLVVVTLLIILGFACWSENVVASPSVFFPTGFAGTMKGASALFFGFVGFDEVCCLAGQAKNPARTMPKALAGTLFGAAIISCIAQLAMASAMPTPYTEASWSLAFGAKGFELGRILASVGECALLPLVVFIAFLPQPELLGAMAIDGIFPPIFAQRSKSGVYFSGTWISGAFMVLLAAFMPFSTLWNMVNIGVLMSFNLSNSSLIMLRSRQGSVESSKPVGVGVGALWLFAFITAYTFWKGVCEPSTSGGNVSTTAWIISALGLAATIATVIAIKTAIKEDTKFSDSEEEFFKCPAVPFIPGLAILVNFLMMATMSWSDHLYTALLVVAFVGVYLAYRLACGKDEDSKVQV